MKTWQKVGLSVVTVGITATALYYGYKALKKVRDQKKAAAEEAAKPKEETPATLATTNTVEPKNETKQP